MKKILLLIMLFFFCMSYVIAQTETEPNNVWNQSNVITLNATGTGTAAAGYDEDWWRVATPGDGKLTVNWTSTNGSFVYCQIYDTLGTIILANTYTSTTATLNVDGLAKGTYYLRFITYYSTESTTYSFVPSFTAASVNNNTEPDSTVVLAKTLPLNGSVTGHINYYFNNHRDSSDWYKVTVTQDGMLSYTITSGNGQNVYARLYDGDGIAFLTGAYTSTSATYTKDGLSPGVYYIHIYTYFTTEYVPYTLSNTFTAPPNANDVVANETPAAASNLPLNGSVTGHIGYHYNGARDDVDWWKVNVNADGRLDFTITSGNGQNVYAQLFDGDAATFLAGSYTTTNATYSKDGLAPGVYYIRVQTYYSTEFASYILSNNLVQPLQVNDIGTNDVYTNALLLPLNGSLTGHIGYRYNGNIDAVDWYKVTTNVDGQMTFNITSVNSANVYAQLFDGDAVTFLAGGYTTTNATYSKDGLAAGTYYIRVQTYYSNEFAPYTLSNTLITIPSPTDGEPNNSRATASVLPVNSTINGHTGYKYNGTRDGFDYFAITIPADGKLSWTITSINAQNLYAQLFDNDGTTFLAGSYTTTTATYSKDGLAAGTYYILVQTYFSSEFTPYALANTFEPMSFAAENAASNKFAAIGTLLPANTAKTGHVNYYYNLQKDNEDWWQIGYDGTGTMNLTIDVEPYLGGSTYPLVSYALYADTTAASLLNNYFTGSTITFNLTGLAVGKYYLRIGAYYGNEFASYRLTAAYTEKCANVVGVTSSALQTGCIGTITYNITGGLVPYSVQLYKNGNPTGAVQTTANGSIAFDNLGIGSYYARSYSFGGSGQCNNISATTTFAVPATPTITGTASFCAGGSTTLTSSTAASYLWSNGATTQSITVSTGGSYTVTVKNAAGCTSATSAATIVTVNPLPTVTLSPFNAVCNTIPAFALTGGSPAGGTYSGPGVNNGLFNPSIAGVGTDTITYSYTNGNGCTSTVKSTIVVNNCGNCTATITAGGATTFCQGGSVVLTASTGASYLWSNGATTQSITVSNSGNYTVTVTDANSCSATSAATVVTVNALPATPTITAGGPTTFCAGGSVTLTSSKAFSYLWTNGATTQSITTGDPDIYILTVKNEAGCTSSTSLVVTVYALPATPTITVSGPTTFCAGGSVTLTSYTAASYLWSNGATTQSITTGSAGIYSVTVKNTAGCTSATSAAVTVAVNTLPTITLGTFNAVCNTIPAFILTGGTPAGGVYSGAGVSNGQFNPATAGVGTQTITYTYTNGNGCKASAQQPIVVNNCATCIATITTGGPTTFCQGGSVVLSASAGATYRWSNGATTQNITASNSGNYTVTVTDANNCSATSAATVVTVNALPSTPTITAGGPTTFCAPGTVVLSSSAAASYLWSNGATTPSITVSASGSYSVTVKNTAGCSARSAAVVVTVNNCGNTYCTAGGTSCIKGYINKVEACYGFSNTTGFTGYSDYTSKTVTSAPGKILGIDVTPGYPVGAAPVPMYIKTWIDWNGDGDFTDMGETVFAPSIPITVKTKFWVKVPLGTTPGNKRMRVALRSDISPGGCGSFTYGEVEDYTVVIVAARFTAPDISVNDFDAAGNSFQIYPNPVSDRIIIERSGYDEAKAKASPAQMMMTDANGRIVLQARLTSLVQGIDVSRLVNGIYFVTIITTADKKTSRVIINH